MRRSHAAHVVAASRPAQAPWASTLGQPRPWVGRGSGRTSRHCERPLVLRTKSRYEETTRRIRGRQLNRHAPATSRVCRSGNRRHPGPNAIGPSRGRGRRRASIWRHDRRLPMRPKTATRWAVAPRGHTRAAGATLRRRRRSSHKTQRRARPSFASRVPWTDQLRWCWIGEIVTGMPIIPGYFRQLLMSIRFQSRSGERQGPP